MHRDGGAQIRLFLRQPWAWGGRPPRPAPLGVRGQSPVPVHSPEPDVGCVPRGPAPKARILEAKAFPGDAVHVAAERPGSLEALDGLDPSLPCSGWPCGWVSRDEPGRLPPGPRERPISAAACSAPGSREPPGKARVALCSYVASESYRNFFCSSRSCLIILYSSIFFLF